MHSSLLLSAAAIFASHALAQVHPSEEQLFPWRNDSANLLLTKLLNKYLAATPLSDDVTGPSISDQPPVSLDWSLGPDLPHMAQKDGVGCWIGSDFVVAGGLWEPLDGPHKPTIPPTRAMRLDTVSMSWSLMPDAPFAQTRGTGACTPDSLFLVGGRNTRTPHRGCDVARLRRDNSTGAGSFLDAYVITR